MTAEELARIRAQMEMQEAAPEAPKERLVPDYAAKLREFDATRPEAVARADKAKEIASKQSLGGGLLSALGGFFSAGAHDPNKVIQQHQEMGEQARAQELENFDAERKGLRERIGLEMDADKEERGERVRQEDRQKKLDSADPLSAYSMAKVKQLAMAYGYDPTELIGKVSADEAMNLIQYKTQDRRIQEANAERDQDRREDKEFKKQMFDWQKEQARIQQKERLEAKEAENRRREDERAKVRATLSDKQVSEIQDFDNILNEVKELENTFSKDYVGPIQGRVWDVLSNAEKNAYRSRVGRMTDAYRRIVTGAAAPDKELQRIESRLPHPSDPDETFLRKMKDYKETMEKGRRRYLDLLAKKGKDVSEFLDEAPAGKKVVQKLYSKSRDQTKLVYEDGSEEIVDGQR